jgi:glutathione S-transferase
MYTLYFAPGAASLVVHWLLIDLDLPHELVKLDIATRQHKTPEYLALNPSGVVPTLLIDGKPMCEAAAMAMLLADAKPEAGLAPALGSAKRTEFYQWMFHLANSLQPPFRLWWYPAEAAGEASAVSRLSRAWCCHCCSMSKARTNPGDSRCPITSSTVAGVQLPGSV